MTIFNLYSSPNNTNAVRVVSDDEIAEIKSAYSFLVNYEMIEQKYAVIINNWLDLANEMVTGLHRERYSPSPATLMYFNCEINRRIFNILSSMYAYHEFMKELRRENISNVSTLDFKDYFSLRRSQNVDLALAWNLRHYYNHFGFPVMGIGVYLKRNAPESPTVMGVEMHIMPQELLKTRFEWKHGTQAFLQGKHDKFDVLPIINRSVAIWQDIHENTRKHYSSFLFKYDSMLRELFRSVGKDIYTDLMCIADAEKVHAKNGEQEYINYDILLHGQFLQRVEFYLKNFATKANPNGLYYSLSPKEPN